MIIIVKILSIIGIVYFLYGYSKLAIMYFIFENNG